jgi:AAA15 family ATPase/GTPase
MIPNRRLRTLPHHKYKFKDFEILKLASIYGANGAGKSNLVKAIALIQDIVLKEKLPFVLKETRFKFQNPEENPAQLLAIEFIQDNQPFYYAIEITNEIISTEELYLSGLGKTEDRLLFERKTNKEKKTTISFLEEFEKDEKSQLLKSVLIESLVKPNKPLLKLLAENGNQFLTSIKTAFKWFDETLQILTPDSKPNALAHRIDIDASFKKYAEDVMCSLNIGIKSLKTEKKSISDFFDKNNDTELEDLIKELEESPKKMLGLRSRGGDELVLLKEDGEIVIEQLKLEHIGKDNISAQFDLDEESDGTIRLLDFIPAFQDIVKNSRVFIIDEIERSIHPLLIKELVQKFSLDDTSNGQLIFTTHESNLLDQNIFRQDEIWFAEKDSSGVTDLYSLSDYKEHNTIDIRKGYLNGRYGSVPFLANLHDLNWHSDVD